MPEYQLSRKTFAVERIIANLADGDTELERRALVISRNSQGTLPPHLCVENAKQDMAEETLAKIEVSPA
ncbi:MAG: hypothetical protein WCT25_04945 [Candidatus Paceibacterota bacterium]|jgi:hypothetical protein